MLKMASKVKLKLILAVCVIIFSDTMSSGLYCFQCSLFAGTNSCPTNSAVITVWKKLPNKYTVIDGAEASYSCVLGYDAIKSVIHQASVSTTMCESAGFQTSLMLKINSASSAGDSKVACCSKTGCNWNVTTATQDLSYDEIIQSASSGSGAAIISASLDWAPIVLIVIIVIILICCICCLFCLRQKKKGDNNDKAFVSERAPYVSNPNHFRDRSEMVPTPVKRIDVQEYDNSRSVTPANPKDKERYSAVHARLFQKNENQGLKGVNDYKYHHDDSSGYSSGNTSSYSHAKQRISNVSKDVFDNSDFHRANKTTTSDEMRMPRKGQDWVHIWKSATDPSYVEKGSDVNAFRYNSA